MTTPEFLSNLENGLNRKVQEIWDYTPDKDIVFTKATKWTEAMIQVQKEIPDMAAERLNTFLNDQEDQSPSFRQYILGESQDVVRKVLLNAKDRFFLM